MHRDLKIAIDCQSKFRVIGTGRWADFGSDWLCAHDIVHHLPNDRGTVQEEIMTFGAEYWIDSRTGVYEELNQGSIEGGLCAPLVALGQLKGYVLPEAPPLTNPLPAKLQKIFERGAELGLCAMAQVAQDLSRDHAEEDLSTEWVEKLAGEQNQARMVDWMAHGYRTAQARYKSKAVARKLFGTIKMMLAGITEDGGTVHIRINEDTGAVTGLNRLARLNLDQNGKPTSFQALVADV